MAAADQPYLQRGKAERLGVSSGTPTSPITLQGTPMRKTHLTIGLMALAAATILSPTNPGAAAGAAASATPSAG